jgi:hypothetical protein
MFPKGRVSRSGATALQTEDGDLGGSEEREEVPGGCGEEYGAHGETRGNSWTQARAQAKAKTLGQAQIWADAQGEAQSQAQAQAKAQAHVQVQALAQAQAQA